MSSSGYVPVPAQATTICTRCDGSPFQIQSTSSCPAGPKGCPVLLASGQLSFDLPLLSVPAIGSTGFAFGLSYLSGFPGSTSIDGTVGVNFNYPQNPRLVKVPVLIGGIWLEEIALQTGENTQEPFRSVGGAFSSASNNTAAYLQVFNPFTSSEYFTLTSREGAVSKFAGLEPTIAAPGRLVSFTDRFGNTQTFNWTAVGGLIQLQSVTDAYGRTSTFTYSTSSPYNLTQVTDCLGRQVNFQYDGGGRLVAVLGPNITRGADSNGNTFPYGTGYVFEYDYLNPLDARKNDLIAMYYPNQVAPYVSTSSRVIDVASVLSSATPRRQIQYNQDPTDPFNFGRVSLVIESKTGSGMSGAGAWGYQYQDTGLPTNPLDSSDPIVSRTIETDRNGNVVYWDFNSASMLVHKEVVANRYKNSLQAGSFETWTKYNTHNQKSFEVLPTGDSVRYGYEDETNTITFPATGGIPYARRIGLLSSVTRFAGNSVPGGVLPAGRPGSNGQSQLQQLFFYDPLFNQQCAMVEVRGNPIDASNDFFVPQNLGTTPSISDRTRYTTTTFFDYQKDLTTTVQADPDLQALLFPGISSGTASSNIAALISFVSNQIYGARAGTFQMGIGDVNGDGTGNGAPYGDARYQGCVVKVASPSVRQLIPNVQGAYPQTVLFDSPAAYWRLGETSGTTAADSSGNGYSGTYTGGYTLDEPGALAKDNNPSALFDGSSGCVDCGTASPIAGGGDFTVEAWINVTAFIEAVSGLWISYAVTKGADYLYDVGGHTTNAYGIGVNGGTDGSGHASAGAGLFFMCGLPDPTYNSYLAWTADISPGQWYHVIGVKQGATMSLYVNGQLKASHAYSGSINADSTLEMLIGKTQRGSPYTYRFDGKADEVALYNTALSADRILAHYNAGTGGDAWVWQSQSIVELYTSNKAGQQTTYTNAEGNLTVYVRFPQNNPDGNSDVDDPSLGMQQYGRVMKVVTDAQPTTVMTLVGSYGDLSSFTGGIIPRFNTPGTYLALTTSHAGTTGCTTCNYDPMGNVLTTVDARGNTTTYSRNELGEVYQVTMPAPYSYQIETSYDANRNVIQVDTQDMQVKYTSTDPSSPYYAQFIPTGSGSTANVPLQAGPGGSVRTGWFSNLYTYDLIDNKIEDDIDATGSSPSDLTTKYAYDPNQNLTKITKPLANTIEYDYDERNLKIAIRVGGSSGSVTVMSYDPIGNLMDVMGPATRGTAAQTLSVLIGNAFGAGSGVTFQGDWVAQNTFDAFDRVVGSVDAAGGTVAKTFDPGSRVIATQIFGAPGGATPVDRGGSANILLASEETRFDEAGRQYETQQDVFLDAGYYLGAPGALPSGRAVTHTGGGLASNSTANNHTATVTLTTGGISYVLSRIVFDRIGRVSGAATDNGAVATLAYDGANRAIAITDALGNLRQQTFDPNGNLTGFTRTDVCTISGSISTESFGALIYYDVMNQLVVKASQGADGTLTSYFPTPGSATIYTLLGYDSRGNRANLIDAKLNTTVFDFDGASRLLETDQHLRAGGVGTNAIASTVTTKQAYDANSNLSKLTDSNGGATWFYYDTLDRQTSLVFYDGSTRTYGYDPANDITSYTDENGSAFANTFDVLGRKTAVGITLAAGVVGTTAQAFQFDGLSRMTFGQDTVGTTSANVGITFDSISRILEEQQTYQGSTRYVTRNAWTGYPPTGFTFPNSRQITIGFDALYRKNAIHEASGGSSIAAWQFFGGRTATVTLGNGMVTSYMNNAQSRSAIQSGQTTPGWGTISTDQLGYDGAGRLVGKRHFNGSSVFAGFTSAYDLSSNKPFERPLHAESRASLYASATTYYDSMDRLLDYQRGTLASGGGSISSAIALPGTNKEQAYNLDPLGNWSTTTITPEGGSASTQSRSHNLLNQITAYGVSPTSTPVYYDQGNNTGTPPQKGNGNIVDDGIRTMAYDPFNRLTTVSRKTDGLQIGGYAYDALGRRVQKTVSHGGLTTTIPNGTARYLYDGARIVEELVSTSTTIQYVWGQYIDELIQLKALTTIGPQPLAAGSYYLLSDLLYRSAALTNSSAGIVEAYDADAYGNTLLFSGPGTDGLWFTNDDVQAAYSACRYVFTGRDYDAEAQICFYRARYYASGLGRFLSRDPVGSAGGCNLYEYCADQPVGLTDFTGLQGAVGYMPFSLGLGGPPIELNAQPDVLNQYRGINGQLVHVPPIPHPVVADLPDSLLPDFLRHPINTALTGTGRPSPNISTAASSGFHEQACIQTNCYLDCMKSFGLAALGVGAGLGAAPDVPIFPKVLTYPWLDPTNYYRYTLTGDIGTIRTGAAAIAQQQEWVGARQWLMAGRGLRVARGGTNPIWAQGGRGAVRGGVAAVAAASIYCSIKCLDEYYDPQGEVTHAWNHETYPPLPGAALLHGR